MTQTARSVATSTTETERARFASEALHSVRMEGLDATPEGERDTEEYVAGVIDADELVHRTRARYGVPEMTEQGSAGRQRPGAAVTA